MRKNALTAIIKAYDNKCALYADFAEKLKGLVEALIKENNAHVHSIASRVKDRNALKNKLERSEEKYESLSDVTDLVGIRIITFFADDVDTIAKIIKSEFDIDADNSVDKRVLLDPDRFGYLSLHYVAKLPANRVKLTEYQRFLNCKVEIQIRSILQHTWAEIEHDLGYKSKQAVPKEVRRRFSRLAGLLELADDEFMQIRDSLVEYEKTVPHRIATSPTSVLIDKASLFAFIKNSSLVKKIDKGIAALTAGRIAGVMNDDMLSSMVDELKYVGLETIADIVSSLCKFEGIIYGFVEAWLAGRKLGRVSKGICLFYLCYVVVGHRNSIEYAFTYLNKQNIGLPSDRGSGAKRVISIYNSVADVKQKKA